MADTSGDGSSNLGVARRKSDLHNQHSSDQISAEHSVVVETEFYSGDIDLSNTHDVKVGTTSDQNQDMCDNVARSGEDNFPVSLTSSSSESVTDSGFDLENSGNATSNKENLFPGFKRDKMNVYIKAEDYLHNAGDSKDEINSGANSSLNSEAINDSEETGTNSSLNSEEIIDSEETGVNTSLNGEEIIDSEETGANSSLNSEEIIDSEETGVNISLNSEEIIDSEETGANSSLNSEEIIDSEETDTVENNHAADRKGEIDLEEVTSESDYDSLIENLLSLHRESQEKNKLKLVVIDEHETDQRSLDNLKDKSNEISHVKMSADCEDQTQENEQMNENIEDLMRYLLSFVAFQIRDVLVYMVPDAKWHPPAVDDIPWNWLKEEKWRLHTYSRYPHGANKSAILLAEAGFAYIGSGKDRDDKVICYFCCEVKQDWRPSDVIAEVHRHLSPDCSMVTGINCDNVPMTMPKVGLHLFSQLNNYRELLASEGTRQKAGDDIDRDGAEASPVSRPEASNHSRPTFPAKSVGSSQVSGQQSDNYSTQASSTHSAGSSQNGTSAHVQMATQTIMGPSSSSRSQSAPDSARFSQPTSSDVPSTTVTSNSILASSETGPSSTQVAVPQGQNSVPGETQIADTSNQNVHPLSDQTAVSSSATVVSPAGQGDSSHNQNSSTATSLSSVTTSTTISSATPAAPSSLNTSVNQSTTESQENPSQNNSDSQNSARAAGRNPTYGELGIITERPKRYEFAVRAKRLESFEPWPRDHHLKKEDLADAGFYYAGYGDCARCFYCGGGLRNWEDNDDVWVEHARWFPKCAFIRQTMGQQFVDTVQDLNKSHDQITFEMVTNKMGSSATSFQLDTKNMPLKRDPAVITVLAMGYEEKDVLEAANAVKDACGVLSADKLFEKLEQDGKHRRTTESPAESQAIRNKRESKDEEVMNQLKEQNNQLRQQTVCKICMDKEVAVVFLPCGHLVSCTDCAAALKDCPVCRNLVRGIVRAFMA